MFFIMLAPYQSTPQIFDLLNIATRLGDSFRLLDSLNELRNLTHDKIRVETTPILLKLKSRRAP